MNKQTTIFVALASAVAMIALAMSVVALLIAWNNQPLKSQKHVETLELTTIAGIEPIFGDVALELSAFDQGGNTQCYWHCGKILAGTRYDYAGAWSHLQGGLLIDSQTQQLKAVELHISIGSMRGQGNHPAPSGLINTLFDNQWFLVEQYPDAIFTSHTITRRNEPESDNFEQSIAQYSHLLQGTFQLNGIEKEIVIPAQIMVHGSSIEIHAQFPISRNDYAVHHRKGVMPPATVDDRVLMEVHVLASPDPTSLLAETNRLLIAQQAQASELHLQVEQLAQELGQLRNRVQLANLHQNTPPAVIDFKSLPEHFIDQVDYRNSANDPSYKDLGYNAEFEMVLVPGDTSKNIGPFYVQTTEVTWRMFRAWAYCEDIANDARMVELKDLGLRPSPCYDDASRGHGFEGRAALGLSRKNAMAFCQFLSEQTGRSYRLMSNDEWVYLANAAGGIPEHLDEVAWLSGNVGTDELGDPISMPVAQKAANQLGLFDFWGNVGEWVMDDTQYIRGGSFMVTQGDLTFDWREDESQDIWNATYPNRPLSQWWYRDRFDMGFRLVCDPIHIPESD